MGVSAVAGAWEHTESFAVGRLTLARRSTGQVLISLVLTVREQSKHCSGCWQVLRLCKHSVPARQGGED